MEFRTLDQISWPIKTRRLHLRSATPGDAEATWRFRRLEEVSRWLTSAPASFDQHCTGFQRTDRLKNTLVIECDGEIIGDLMLKIEDGWAQAEVAEQARRAQAELGWVLHPDHAGHGYATEAVRELVRLCFQELGLRRVTAYCFADNVASKALMERIGMRCEGRTTADSLHRSGKWLDGLSYALLADEFGRRRFVSHQ